MGGRSPQRAPSKVPRTLSPVRMEYVWVSAYVNRNPSRGAKDGGWDLTPPVPHPNTSLNAWAPLDVSYKQ